MSHPPPFTARPNKSLNPSPQHWQPKPPVEDFDAGFPAAPVAFSSDSDLAADSHELIAVSQVHAKGIS
ncbi:hypothetical protein [Streptomyces sp. NPDC088554]|uniref:hypothetical protein n=1 Tax=Streptomyces sp. NPDC088554 TaxID=3365865 RepID=UPI0038047F88